MRWVEYLCGLWGNAWQCERLRERKDHKIKMQRKEALTLGDTFTCYIVLLTARARAWDAARQTLLVCLSTRSAL
jgi:hypothetical protein